MKGCKIRWLDSHWWNQPRIQRGPVTYSPFIGEILLILIWSRRLEGHQATSWLPNHSLYESRNRYRKERPTQEYTIEVYWHVCSRPNRPSRPLIHYRSQSETASRTNLATLLFYEIRSRELSISWQLIETASFVSKKSFTLPELLCKQ